jgi:hypothetical protein
MAKALPPIFGAANPSLYTNAPVGNAVQGIKAIRGRAQAQNRAAVTPYKVGSAKFPNGKKVKVIKP